MSRKKLMTTIYITPEQADALQRLSRETRVPKAVFIREAIDELLRQKASEQQDVILPTYPSS